MFYIHIWYVIYINTFVLWQLGAAKSLRGIDGCSRGQRINVWQYIRILSVAHSGALFELFNSLFQTWLSGASSPITFTLQIFKRINILLLISICYTQESCDSTINSFLSHDPFDISTLMGCILATPLQCSCRLARPINIYL